MSEVKWFRARFYSSSVADFRPIYKGQFPEGPWWCSGYTGDMKKAIIIAFVKSFKTLKKQWPEAEDIEVQEVIKPSFSDRFPKPDWWIE